MIRNKIIFLALILGTFFFISNVHADLYLNSKTGTIYFNTTGVARASIGPGGNFSINTSDFFVNQKNLEFGFLDVRRADLRRHDRHIENSENKFMDSSEFSKVQFLENGERIVHQKNLEFGFIKNKLVFECAQESGDSRHLDPKVLTTSREGLFDNNLGRVEGLDE